LQAPVELLAEIAELDHGRQLAPSTSHIVDIADQFSGQIRGREKAVSGAGSKFVSADVCGSKC
jgi:hypothetical protein